jgi:hypothetical protein
LHGAVGCSSAIITLLFLFQTLLKKNEAVGAEGADTGDGSHPKAAIDGEVTGIGSKSLMDPRDHVTAGGTTKEPIDDTCQVDEPEV